MKRDIDKFVKELADYINRFVAGRDGSHIEKCMVEKSVLNRGHAIPVRCTVPGDDESMAIGPCFYAEELLEEFPHSSVTAIAEYIRVKTEEIYPNLLHMMQMQQEVESKNIQDISTDKLFLTAYRTENVDEKFHGGYITREYEELGLTASIKTAVDNATDENQIYLLPVMSDQNHQLSEKYWETAELNSLKASRIFLNGKSAAKNEPPVCGFIKDMEQFYDYFYLLTPQVWTQVIEDAKAERLYIFPHDAYNAGFCVDNRNIKNNSQAAAFRDKFMLAAVALMNGNDAFVLDCKTMKITKFRQ